MKHPIQPLVKDRHGVLRFKVNAIVARLSDFAHEHGYGFNEILCDGYSDEDQEQFAQLIGYSLSGYGDLSFISDEAVWAVMESIEPVVEKYQYYYRNTECPAHKPTDDNCICWHDEGAGPHPEWQYKPKFFNDEWRIKPATVEVNDK